MVRALPGGWSIASTCPWRPAPMCPPSPRTRSAPPTSYTLLAQAGRALRWVEHVRATIPTPDDTTTLHIPTGLPVLITRRVTTDTDGRPIAMEETRRSAEDTQLSYPQSSTE
jgi:GntR family transcriptional regulator